MERVGLLSLILVAFGLRVYQLDADSLWLDEIHQSLVAQEKSLLDVLRNVFRTQAAAPPLDYLLLHLFTLTGTKNFIVRFPSAVYGVLSIAAMYKFGLLVLDKQTRIVSVLLFITSPFHIYYSQESRFYSLFTLTSLLSLIFFYEAVERKSWFAWVKFGFIVVVSFYTHYFTALLIFSMGILLTINTAQEYAKGQQKSMGEILTPFLKFSIAMLGVALFVAPLIAPAFLAKNAHGLYLPPKLFDSIYYTFSSFTNGVAEIQTNVYKFQLPDWIMWVYFLALYIGGGVRYSKTKNIIILLIVPLLLTVFIDAKAQYFFHPRQVVFVLPMFLIIVAEGIKQFSFSLATITRSHKKTAQHILFSILVIIFVATNIMLLPGYYRSEKENWRDVATLISTNYKPGDVIATFGVPPDAFKYGVGYYLPPELVEKLIFINSPQDIESLRKIYVEHSARMWIVVAPYDSPSVDLTIGKIDEMLDDFNSWQMFVSGYIRLAYINQSGQTVSPSEIITLTGQALNAQPDSLAFTLTLTDAYTQQGDLIEATALYRKAKKINLDTWWEHITLKTTTEIDFTAEKNNQFINKRYRTIFPNTMTPLDLQLKASQPRQLGLTYFDFPGGGFRILINGQPVDKITGGIGNDWQTYYIIIPDSATDKLEITLIGTGITGILIDKLWLEYIPAKINFEDVSGVDWTTESFKNIITGTSYQGWLNLDASRPRQLKLTYLHFPNKNLQIFIDNQLVGEIIGSSQADAWPTLIIDVPPLSKDTILFSLKNPTETEAFGVSRIQLEYRP